MSKSKLCLGKEYSRRFFFELIKTPQGIYLYCFLISLLYLLLCTKSSPLYPFNDWVDVNAFFTMGKGMMHGLVPYRDLFEQKGPLLYFLYGIASLISYRTFIGVFILEVIAFSFFLFFSFKSMSLFIDKRNTLVLLPVLTILILNQKSFTHGGSAEELCLPLLATSLYYLLRYLKESDSESASDSIFFGNGLIAGCILWIKFSLLGFWAGWVIAYVINLVSKKKNRQAILGCGFFLLGMLAATLPWAVYFGLNQAIPDWFNTYFVINLTSYPAVISLFDRFLNILYLLLANLTISPFSGILLWFGILAFTLFKKFLPNGQNRLFLLFSFFLLSFGIYSGGLAFIYYYLIFMPFLILGMIALVDAVKSKLKTELQIGCVTGLISATILISLPLVYRNNQNTYMLHFAQEELVQYKFASIINQTQNPTLLNYGSLDMGFYTTTGILPSNKYFELQNLEYSRYPFNLDEQNRYVREGLQEFVVYQDYVNMDKEIIPYLNSDYQLVASDDQYFEGYQFTYYLYKKVE